MEYSDLIFKFFGISKNSIKERDATDEGIIHGILLKNKNEEKGLAIFISTITIKENNPEDEESLGVFGGYIREDLKKQLEKLKKDDWVPLGVMQIEIGKKAVEDFLRGDNPFALIDIIKDLKDGNFNYERNKLNNNYFSYIL